MLIGGLILLAIGGVLVFLAFKMSDKILKLRATDVKPVKELLETYTAVAEDLGEMTHKALATVGVYGRVKCDEPLEAPLSEQPCIYYDYKEEYQVEFEESYEETNEDGDTITKTRMKREWRNGSSDKKYVSFLVNDETSEIEVDAESLVFDLKHNKKAETTPMNNNQGLLDSFLSALSNREKVIALRKTETIVPVDFKVFVTGAITPTNTGMILAKHQDGKEIFTLADRSQDALVKDVQSRQKMLYIFGGLLDVTGVILTIVGIIK